MNNRNTIILFFPQITLLWTGIRSTIIYKNNLQIGISLMYNTINALIQIFLYIINWYDNRH